VVPPPQPWRHPVVAVTLVATLLVAIVDESVVVVGLLMVEEPDMALVPQPDCNVKFAGRLVIRPTIVSVDLRKTMLLKLVLLLLLLLPVRTIIGTRTLALSTILPGTSTSSPFMSITLATIRYMLQMGHV
jgi:hypothetical protein